jgi:hypothetical protein
MGRSSDWTEKGESSQCNGDCQCPSPNLARLALHLLTFGAARDRLSRPIHVTLTA